MRVMPTACMSGGPDLANDGSVGAADGCSLFMHGVVLVQPLIKRQEDPTGR